MCHAERENALCHEQTIGTHISLRICIFLPEFSRIASRNVDVLPSSYMRSGTRLQEESITGGWDEGLV